MLVRFQMSNLIETAQMSPHLLVWVNQIIEARIGVGLQIIEACIVIGLQIIAARMAVGLQIIAARIGVRLQAGV